MASPSQPRSTYHVFLSFRGPDSRDNIVSHLYNALKQAGIYTYIDSEELMKGERISEALPRAIEDSCIALIVFSEQYATSQWCLKEVTKIMECKDTNGLLVLPMFFKVDPKEVRGGRDSYKNAFRTYEKKCEEGNAVGFNLEDVKKWKQALFKAGELSGWVYSDEVLMKLENGVLSQSGSKDIRNEAQLVTLIVDLISERLERRPLDVAKETVGMPSQVNDVIKLLNMGSEDELQHKILMIGLWAMGGIGKTILAKLLYNSIFKDFQDADFLEIQNNSKNLISLQDRMLRKLTNANIRVTSHHEAIATMKDRLKCKKVLLILDGVDDISQIDNLIGEEHDFFGKGSRIIVTTRNKSVFSKRKAIIYKVKALENHEACELLRMCASEDGNQEISENLVESALKCTRCLPLALKELGFAFRKRSDDNDRSVEVNKVAKLSSLNINKELKKSLHGLDNITEEIFLDIACFFDGWNRKYVEGLLGVCYVKICNDGHCYEETCYDVADSKGKDHVIDLIERSLIMDENGTLQVHPFIKIMGQKTETSHILEKRRRLWCHDDIVKILSDDNGEYDVEAIVLAPKEPQEIGKKIGANAFLKLKKLRFLIMINVQLKTFPDPIELPYQLRWFEWPECPASSLKLSSSPLNPGVLAVRKSLLGKKPGEP